MSTKILTGFFLFGLIGGIINCTISETTGELFGWLSSTAYSATCLMLLYAPSK